MGMSIVISNELEMKLRGRAEAEGLSVQAYIEWLMDIREREKEELTTLALEGLQSGEPNEIGPDYWPAKHRRLEERLNKTRLR